jgi:chromosome segregation ATPase
VVLFEQSKRTFNTLKREKVGVMTIDITNTRTEAHRQLLSNADARLKELTTEQQSIEMRMAAIISQQDAIRSRAASRQQQLNQARQNAESVQKRSLIASEEKHLAEGTALSQEKATAFSSHVVAASRAVTERNDLAERDKAERQQEAIDMEKLVTEHHALTLRLHQTEQEVMVAHTTREHALADLGQSELEEHMARIQEAHAELAAKEREVALAREKLDTCSVDALQALHPWQSLQAQIQPLCTVHDPSIEIMEAYLHFLALLLEKGYHADLPVEEILYKTGLHQFRAFSELLDLKQDDLNPAFHRLNPPVALQDRRSHVAKILEVYREKLKGN